MRVEVPLGVRFSVEGMLVEAHRIREGDIENAIVSRSDLPQQSAQLGNFRRLELRKRPQVPAATHQSFEGPNRPKRHHGNKSIVRIDHALLLSLFKRYVVA